jgi:hypothetical protein
VDWLILGILGGGTAALAGLARARKHQQLAIAASSGLEPAVDLTHVPAALQRTALWSLAEGGFERRAVHGVVARAGSDIAVTAFDLETLRERRGEWAWLPVEPPFRIGGVVSVVVCEVDRTFPHTLLKRAGRGDKLIDDPLIGRTNATVKTVRDILRLERAHEAELPPTLAAAPLAIGLPEHWRAYGQTIDSVLATPALHAALAHAHRRDLVIELLDSLVVVYPAALDVSGADAFADLIETALGIVDALRGAILSPRGVEPA